LSSKNGAEVDFLAVDADPTAGSYGDGFIVEGILHVRQSLILAARGPIEVAGALHV
jgi:hypothetical protein